jgi:hypothetical protein
MPVWVHRVHDECNYWRSYERRIEGMKNMEKKERRWLKRENRHGN